MGGANGGPNLFATLLRYHALLPRSYLRRPPLLHHLGVRSFATSSNRSYGRLFVGGSSTWMQQFARASALCGSRQKPNILKSWFTRTNFNVASENGLSMLAPTCGPN